MAVLLGKSRGSGFIIAANTARSAGITVEIRMQDNPKGPRTQIMGSL